MEEWERQLIVKNMDRLVKTTICNVRLLAVLQASEILGDDDIDVLMGLANNRGNQVFQLYTILQKRVNAFEALLEGLQQTNQSGAVAILTAGLDQNSPVIDNLSISYDVNHVLGIGSYGTVVYKGKFGDRDVAVKKVPHLFGGAQALHEVKVLKSCDAHPNIVRYFGAKQSKEFVLIALELCEMSLNQWVESNANNEITTLNKKTELSCMDVLRQITTGLEWLHSKKIVHRDVKPENVLLLLQMKRAKLSDFGLSRQIMDGNSFVATSSSGGSHGWMAPEILAYVVQKKSTECKFTYASDVFSLGCVYYFVLTNGKFAFGDLVRCQANILDGNPLIVEREIKQDCDQRIMSNLIKFMISKDPKSRPPCATILSSPFWSQSDLTVKDLGNTSILSPLYPKTNWVLACDGNPAQVFSLVEQQKKVVETVKPCVSAVSTTISLNTEDEGKIQNWRLDISPAKFWKIKRYVKNLNQVGLQKRTEELLKLIEVEDLCVIQGILEQGGAGTEEKITEIYDQYENTMLHVAVKRGDYEIVKYLISAQGFNTVLSQPKFGNRVIVSCIHDIYTAGPVPYKNKCNILELLFFKHPPLINSWGLYSVGIYLTPLHLATREAFTNGQQLAFIEFLLKHNADVNAKTEYGDTPLHLAVRKPLSRKVMEIIRLLVNHGADTDAVNKKGYKFWHKKANDVPPDLYNEILEYLISIQKIKRPKKILGFTF